MRKWEIFEIDDATALSILKEANCSLLRAQPNLISKGRFALLSHFFKLAEYIIRCWTFNVRPARNALKLVRGKYNNCDS